MRLDALDARIPRTALALLLAGAAGCLANTIDTPTGFGPDGGAGGASSGGASSGGVGSGGSSGASSGGSGGHGGSSGAGDDGGGSSGGSPSPDGGPSSSGGGADGGARTAAPCKANGSFSGLTMYECDPTGMEGKTAQAAPLVLALHGYTQGAIQTPASGWTPKPGEPGDWGYIATTQWAVLAQTYRFYVVFPDTGSGAPSFQWYSPLVDVSRTAFQAQALVGMVDQMEQTHHIDTSRIFISGLSAGAAMSNLMLACYPDVFAGGASFEGCAVGCDPSCAALGKKPPQWSWPGNHPASDVTSCDASYWSDKTRRKPRLLVFQGQNDGAVTPDNMTDLVQQFAGAYGISTTPTKTGTLSGQQYTEYGGGQLATVYMPGVGHGTPVQPGPAQAAPPYYVAGAPTAPDEGGWDPMPSKTMVDDPNAVQDWTNTTGIYGMYYAAKFWGIVP